MISILLADRHRLVGAALSAILSAEGDIDRVDLVSRGDDVVPACRRLAPGTVVVDSELSTACQQDAFAAIRAELPTTAVLVLTAQGSVSEMRRVMAAGCHGYLRKDIEPTQLVSAVRQVSAGHQAFDHELLVDAVSPRTAGLLPSARELAALRLVASGLSNKEIAKQMHLAPGTVRNYLSNVMTKTCARNRVDAIRIAREWAWI